MVDIIETIDLSKVYKLKGKKTEINALNKVNLSIKKGEIFGLLGPNGAGKTTLIQILTTITQPTSGYAKVNGYNVAQYPKKVKPMIGLMLGSDMLYYRLTGHDNLKFFCKIYKISNYQEKILKISEEFELSNWLSQYVEYYSSGMKMKLALCRTLLLERQILFLDEPTLGLDVKSTNFITEKLKNLNKTIFLTSHDMNVVEKLCDHIAFIDKGNILKIGAKSEIKELLKAQIKVTIEIKENREQLKKELENQKFVEMVDINDSGLEVILKLRDNYHELLQLLSDYNILRINEPEISLEELFLKLIN
ncbi:MAG: ABC transporter ATP-binding protein [Candidatus Hermodarchaeota archaeon]